MTDYFFLSARATSYKDHSSVAKKQKKKTKQTKKKKTQNTIKGSQLQFLNFLLVLFFWGGGGGGGGVCFCLFDIFWPWSK